MGLGGGTAGGLGFSAGAGCAGVPLRGLAGVGGFIPHLDIRVSSSEHPSDPNFPRAAQQGVLAAHVSVRRRERSHSRSADKMAQPPLGFEQQQLVQGGQGDAELRGAQLVPDADPRDVRRVHFHVHDL